MLELRDLIKKRDKTGKDTETDAEATDAKDADEGEVVDLMAARTVRPGEEFFSGPGDLAR